MTTEPIARATYAPDEVAKRLGITRQHCYRLLEEGELRFARKIGGRWHIAIAPFEKWLAGEDDWE